MTALTEETLSVSGHPAGEDVRPAGRVDHPVPDLNARLAALQIRQAMVGRWFFMIIGTIFSITPAFVYWLAGYLTIQGDPSAPTIGDIVAFTTLQSRLFFPLGQLLNVQVEIQGALALFDRIFEYLEMDPEIVDAPDAVALDPAEVRGEVRFHDVSFQYPTEAVPSRGPTRPSPAGTTTRRGAEAERANGTDRADRAAAEACRPIEVLPTFALEHIDFEAEPGELVALVGPSGSGKTTTTYLIPRLYDVDAGAVEIDGLDVRRIKLASLGEIDRGRHPGDVPVPRVGAREPALRAARGDRGRAADGGASPRRSTTGSWSSPRATTRSSASAATSSRAARSSGSRSPGCC